MSKSAKRRWLAVGWLMATFGGAGCERGGSELPAFDYSFLGGASGEKDEVASGGTDVEAGTNGDGGGNSTSPDGELDEPVLLGGNTSSGGAVSNDSGGTDAASMGGAKPGGAGGQPSEGDSPGEPPVIGVALSREPFVLAPACTNQGDCQGEAVCRFGVCASATCGNGELESGEECDDENSQHSDGCELDCRKTRVLDVQSTYSTCVLLSSGAVKCFGTDERGMLGRGTDGDPVVAPAGISPLDFGTSSRVIRLEAGGRTFCVVFENGKARCWGANDSGQLGIGSRDDYGDEPDETLALLPNLPFSEVLEIKPGSRHTCVISLHPTTRNKEVTCWGDSESGQRGDGFIGVLDDASQAMSVALPSVKPIALHTATSTTCLLFEPGEVICWGNNSANGLSGNGNVYAPNVETGVLKLLGTEVDMLAGRAAGSNCTFQVPNTLFCWGGNSGGHLGSPYLLDQNIRTPIQIRLGDKEFVDLQSGTDVNYGLTVEGEVYSFGRRGRTAYAGLYDPELHPDENWAQLPHGGRVDVGDFDGAPGIDPVRRMMVGWSSACVEMIDGSVRCWGANADGRLGYGFDSENGPDELSTWSRIGDDETPGEAFMRLPQPAILLW